MSATRHRILLVTTSIGRGGAERQVVDLARHLLERRWRVAILSMIPATGEHLAELSDAGLEVASLDMAPGRPTPAALGRYVSFARAWHPEIVHSHMVHANLLARAGRTFVRSTPLVSTVHSLVEGGRWREIAYGLTDRFTNVTTAVSSAVAERCVRVGAVPRRRIVTLPNGLDSAHLAVPAGAREAIRLELGAAEDTFLWLAMGRLVGAKGYDLLLPAFSTVLRVAPRARLAIAGDGPERDTLHRLRDELGLGSSVAMLGDRMDGSSLLAGADGFVLSSRWEGLPMVLLEAGAMGLPIVATDVGGAREVVDADVGAVLTAPATEALAAGMLRVAAMDAGERAETGAALRRHVLAKFDMGRIVDRWERLYATVLTTKDHAAQVDWGTRDFTD